MLSWVYAPLSVNLTLRQFNVQNKILFPMLFFTPLIEIFMRLLWQSGIQTALPLLRGRMLDCLLQGKDWFAILHGCEKKKKKSTRCYKIRFSTI